MSVYDELRQKAFGWVVYKGKKIVNSGILYDGRKTLNSMKKALKKDYPDCESVIQQATVKYYCSHSLDELRNKAKQLMGIA